MPKVLHIDRQGALEALLDEHPEARELAETLAQMEQQLGQEAMGLILGLFKAEDAAEGPDDPVLANVTARIEAFESSRGR